MHVILVDFDINILRVAKRYFEKHGVRGHFVCANLQQLPLKDGTIDVSAGIGVIEHTNKIEKTIAELARVTRPGGFTFQTVPAFSLTTLVLNQRCGTVPHIPVLKEISTWIHVDLLGARHMRCGYEESYTRTFLRKAFTDAGFSQPQIGFYDYNQAIIKKVVGNLFRPLVKMRPFWDLIFIKAYKK